jgi:1,4-dihydroxy-2-naphthoate octaprenyltransferase
MIIQLPEGARKFLYGLAAFLFLCAAVTFAFILWPISLMVAPVALYFIMRKVTQHRAQRLADQHARRADLARIWR